MYCDTDTYSTMLQTCDGGDSIVLSASLWGETDTHFNDILQLYCEQLSK